MLLSHFSCVRLFVTPQTAAHHAPLSLGFSRQERWSGLPFPSPMHESEKWKWSCSVNVQLFVTPRTTAYQAPPSMGFSRQEYWSELPLPSPSYDMSCYNFENCFKEMGRNQPWTQRLAVSKTIKMILVRLPVTNFKMTIRADCAVSPWSPCHWSKKVLAHWLLGHRGREWDFGLASALPDTPVTASKIKQTFLSTNFASLLAFERWAARPHFPFQGHLYKSQ